MGCRRAQRRGILVLNAEILHRESKLLSDGLEVFRLHFKEEQTPLRNSGRLAMPNEARTATMLQARLAEARKTPLDCGREFHAGRQRCKPNEFNVVPEVGVEPTRF
jgi:hypothetical protein